MKILRMGYVFNLNALWSIKIWLPPPGPLESVVRWARTEESSESPDKWLGTRITN